MSAIPFNAKLGLTVGTISTPVIDSTANASFASSVVSGNSDLNTIKLAAGAVGTPSFYFTTNTTTGLYLIGINNAGFSVSGSKVLDIASTGLSVTGTVSATTFSGAGTSLTGTAGSLTAGLASSIAAGTVGQILYQSSTGVTAFLGGTTGQLMQFNTSGAPTAFTPSYVGYTVSTGSASLPVGNTTQRDASPSVGYFRYNNQLNQFEGYNNTGWIAISGTLASLVVSGNSDLNSIKLAAGAVGTPSFYFTTNTTSGLYQIGADNIGVAISGSKVLDISSSGLGITGTVTATTLSGTHTGTFYNTALTGTPSAPTAAVNTNTTQVATTAFVIGQASTTLPNPNGVAAIGTGTTFARADHVHAAGTSPGVSVFNYQNFGGF